MDAELLKFESKVTKLIGLAKENGMSDQDIDDCIAEVLKEPLTKKSPRWVTVLKFLLKSWILATVTFLSFLCLVFVAYLFITNFLPQSAVISIEKILIPIAYPAQRFVRLVSLPLHDVFNMSETYHSSCFIKNPWYSGYSGDETSTEMQNPQCNFCTGMEQPARVNIDSTSAENAFNKESIVIYFGYGHDLTLKKLADFYKKHNDELDVHHKGKQLESLTNLMNSDIPFTNQSSLSAVWSTQTEKGLKTLDTLIPRPAIIPPDIEIYPNVTFYALGIKSDLLLVDASMEHRQLLVQLSGAYLMSFTPRDDTCMPYCGEHRAILHPGHYIQYDAWSWKVTIRSNSTDHVPLLYSLDFDTTDMYTVTSEPGELDMEPIPAP